MDSNTQKNFIESISFNKETKSVDIKILEGKDDELYYVFGLEPGDIEGLSNVLVQELRNFIEEKKSA